LRERGDDLELLVGHYVRRFSRELGREVGEVAPEVLERLRGYAWPGNVRELQSVLKQALLRASGPVLLPTFLPEFSGETSAAATVSPQREVVDLGAFLRQRLSPDSHDLYAELHRQVDRLFLTRVLEYTRGNQHQAARLLGIARQTLRLKLRELGLQITRSVDADDQDFA